MYEVESLVPQYLTLLHGVIDSPDIPLNVSRSYLQSDQNVKKISNHITKKVADALEDLFKKERQQYEEKWNSMRIFIEIGILSDEKFYDRASKFFLFSNTDKKFFSLEEYQNHIKEAQTDKDGNVIALYATDDVEQHAYIQAAKAKGYDVLLMDGRFDTMLFNALEQKNEKLRFMRVDADVVDRLIVKEDQPQSDFSKDEQEALTTVFRSQLPKMDKTEFMVDFQNLGADAQPLVITQGEFMRRMKDMAATGANPMMSFYGEMPDSFNLVVNTANPLVLQLLKDEEQACAEQILPLREKKNKADEDITNWNTAHKDAKDEDIPQADKDDKKNIEQQMADARKAIENAVSAYADNNPLVRQLIDLALLSNSMLKGEALSAFVKRSYDLLMK